MGRPKSVEEARCFKHPGAHIVSVGTYETASGRRRRYLCTPVVGPKHKFSLVQFDDDARPMSIPWSIPPRCPDHPVSKVVRNGTYGKSTPKPRQRYRCTPVDGSKQHSFTPTLPRDHVHQGEEHCEHCEELRGVHHGETAVARGHSWSSRIVARGLERLANGGTYAEVSRWAQRVAGVKRTRVSPPSTGGKPKRKASQASKASRNAWHIAADWVEAFSPVIYAPVEAELRVDALEERDRLDGLIEARKPVDRPQVIVIDDAPVWGRELNRRSARKRLDHGYRVLVVAEIHWPAASEEADTFLLGGEPVLNLRLVRAIPKADAEAWRLVFDELGYQPDFVVGDAAAGAQSATSLHFDQKRTKFIPSLWHTIKSIERALADTPGAFTVTPAGKELIDPLAAHLHKLNRRSGTLGTKQSWAAWWDELNALLVANRLPIEKVRARRRQYEAPMAKVLADINRYPQIPVSTGGLETLIAKHVQPMLAMRRTSFANIERTNLLFDLVVAKCHGAFDDLGDVVTLLRADSMKDQGYTVALRTIADPRPKEGVYSSLRDATLVTTLARQRGIK